VGSRCGEWPRETVEKETAGKPLKPAASGETVWGFVVLRLKYCPLSRHCA